MIDTGVGGDFCGRAAKKTNEAKDFGREPIKASSPKK